MRGDTAWNWMIVVLSAKSVTPTYVDGFAQTLAKTLGEVQPARRPKSKA